MCSTWHTGVLVLHLEKCAVLNVKNVHVLKFEMFSRLQSLIKVMNEDIILKHADKKYISCAWE